MSEKIDNALARLREDFRHRTEGRLDDIEQALREAEFTDAAATAELWRRLYGDAHSLKGSGGTAGFPFVSKLAHRLEEFLTAREGALTREDVPALHRFLDTIRDSLEGRDPEDEAQARRTLDALHTDSALASPPTPTPTPTPAPTVSGSAHRAQISPASAGLRAMLVGLSKTENAIVKQALEARGVTVTFSPTASEALGAAVRTPPHLVLLSGILPELQASDFVLALRAMEPTRHARIGVMTSLSKRHAALRRLPGDCRVFRQSGKLLREIDSFLDDALAAGKAGGGGTDNGESGPSSRGC